MAMPLDPIYAFDHVDFEKFIAVGLIPTSWQPTNAFSETLGKV
jgi:hypothetical protein